MYRWNVLLISIIHFILLFPFLNAYEDDCFINEGYICCDKKLVGMMNNVMKESDKLLHVARTIQNDVQMSRGKFETVVAFDDFAYKGLFKAGKACKVSRNGMQAIA
ncbi:Ground-like domain family protein [Acanthocheilonema viteae]